LVFSESHRLFRLYLNPILIIQRMKISRLRWALPALVVLGLSGWANGQAVPSQAFTNVTLHYADGTTVPKATIVWRNGSIEAAGRGVTVPYDAKVIDGGDSLHVYPGWVDGLAEWGMPELSRERTTVPNPGQPTYERAGIQPERQPHTMVVENTRDFTDWRRQGFTAAAVAPRGLMLAGQVDLMTISGSEQNDAAKLLLPGIGVRAAIQGAPGVYPGTAMGVMARFRQLMFDAEALRVNTRLFNANTTAYQAPEKDAVLEALWPVMDGKQPLFFSADDPVDIRRVMKLKGETNFNMVLVSGRSAGKMASELAAANIPVLVSLNYSAKPSHMNSRDSVDKRTPEHKMHNEKQAEAWKESVANMKTLLDAGVKVGFTGLGIRSADLANKMKDLREAGMTDAQLVKVFSTNTAQIIGHGNLLGDLKTGMIAGFNVFTAPFGDSKSKMVYSVASGDLKFYPVQPTPAGNAQRQAGQRGPNMAGDQQ
jgi:imidazolonepropionase-like amidohydrolase